MINNTLPINSLKNKTIELFQKEMIEDIIINNQLNCKCLLIMDNISSNLISKYMSFSEIINSGIFSIDSIYKKRKPYKSFGAIYLISSNENTIKLVLNDFKSEKKRLYKWCFLFSINKIRDNIIELLLNKKFIRRIKALKEINISYIPLDKNLFYFGPKKNYNSLYHLFTNENNNKTINKIDIEKICSICKVTKTYPNIIYFIHDPICKILAIKINKKLKKYFEKIKIEKNGILLLISRKLDIISPIQFDLTYGHLLFELYKNYNKKEENAIKINLEGKDQNIIFNYNDVLYEKYKVMDLSQLMINLNKDKKYFRI
jgi:syntaxin-binding protein 1